METKLTKEKYDALVELCKVLENDHEIYEAMVGHETVLGKLMQEYRQDNLCPHETTRIIDGVEKCSFCSKVF